MPKKHKASQRLLPRQKKFCDEYLIDLNATAAYKRAGYKSRTEKSAGVKAVKLLGNARVKAYLAEKSKIATEKNELSADRTLEEVRRLALSDPRQLFRADGGLKEIPELDAETAACVASVEVEELFEGRGDEREHIGRVKKIKLWNKNTALDQAMRYHALYKDPGSEENPLVVYGIDPKKLTLEQLVRYRKHPELAITDRQAK